MKRAFLFILLLTGILQSTGYAFAKELITKPRRNKGNNKTIDSIKRDFSRSIGISLFSSQNLRGPITAAGRSNQTVEFGPQYGISFYPGLFFEFPAPKNHSYRIFTSYRIIKTTGEANIYVNNTLSSKELVNQELNFWTLGFLYREMPTADSNFWWGYGMEVAKGISGKQDYTDGTTINLSDNLPTNFYAQVSFGYQSHPIRDWQFIPQGNIGVIANNKPFTLNFELLVSTIKTIP